MELAVIPNPKKIANADRASNIRCITF